MNVHFNFTEKISNEHKRQTQKSFFDLARHLPTDNNFIFPVGGFSNNVSDNDTNPHSHGHCCADSFLCHLTFLQQII